LAEALHVTRQTVSNYETGKSQPDIDTIVRLAEALQADPNTLIYGIPTPPERKREYWKTAIAVVVMVLAVVVLLQESALKAWMMENLRPYPYTAHRVFLAPLCYLCVGAALMQVLSLCFGLRPYVQKTTKIAIMILVGVWLALTLTLAVNYMWLDRMCVISAEANGYFDSREYWGFHRIPVLAQIEVWLYYPGLPAPTFLLPGAALWLFRVKKAK